MYLHVVDDDERACREMMATCACEALRRASRSVTSHYQLALAEAGVRPAQLPILVAIRLYQRAPVTALAERLGLDRTTLTRNLAVLEQAGLVAMEDDDDRRMRLAVLTDAGRAVIGPAYESWREAQARLADGFGAERLQALVAELAAFDRATR
ncbi:MAG TPA: MarR family winged helix-turn-helix transcriptional regulator [Acidimicrobiales bacterium]